MLSARWLDLLNAKTTTLFFLSMGCGLIWYLVTEKYIENPGRVINFSIIASCILCGAAAVAGIVTSFLTTIKKLWNFFSVTERIRKFFYDRILRKRIRDDIPHMTYHEKKIIGYLLIRNQKMFVADEDGGYANTLISKGITVRALRPGQAYIMTDVPMQIPDVIWDVLKENHEHFPDTWDESEPYPWRVPWQLR